MHEQRILIKKKLCKGNAALITRKVVLRWSSNTIYQSRTLLPDRRYKLTSLLDSFLLDSLRFSLRPWHRLLDTLHSTLPSIDVATGIFSQFQHTLKTANYCQDSLSSPVHADLNLCQHLVASLVTNDQNHTPKRDTSQTPHMDQGNGRLYYGHGREFCHKSQRLHMGGPFLKVKGNRPRAR